MRSVLNIIRECQCLFIIIKLGCKHLRNACADFCCAAKTHQRKTATTTTAGANVLPMVLSARSLNRIWNQYINHFGTTINALICPILTNFYLQTVWTNPCRNHARNTFLMRMREHHHNFFVCTKI